MRDVWRRNWRFWLVVVEVFLLVLFFTHYLAHRQDVANQRAEVQRRDTCAILATIPGHIPPEIATARHDFARRGHPRDCQPVVHPTPTIRPRPTATVTLRPAPASAQPVNPPRPTPPRSASPTPDPSSSRSPTPSPSPSRSLCLPIICGGQMQPDDPFVDLGYIKCDECIAGNHDECIGLRLVRPFCGCALCPWLYDGWMGVIGDVE